MENPVLSLAVKRSSASADSDMLHTENQRVADLKFATLSFLPEFYQKDSRDVPSSVRQFH